MTEMIDDDTQEMFRDLAAPTEYYQYWYPFCAELEPPWFELTGSNLYK